MLVVICPASLVFRGGDCCGGRARRECIGVGPARDIGARIGVRRVARRSVTSCVCGYAHWQCPRADAPPVEAFVVMEVGKAKALLRTVDEWLSTLTLTLTLTLNPNPQP